MADKPNRNEKPGKGNQGGKPSTPDPEEEMTAGEILLMTILQTRHPNGITDEEWARVAPIRTLDSAAAQRYFSQLEEQHANTTKDFVRRTPEIKRRKRTPKSKAAPVPDDDDEDNLDDGENIPAVQGGAFTVGGRRPTRAPRTQQQPAARGTRGPRTQQQPAASGTRSARARKAKENVKAAKEEDDDAPPAAPATSDDAGTRSALKRKDQAESGPSKRQATAQHNVKTAPASPPRRSPSPAESFNRSLEEEEEMRERLAHERPMSAVYSEWWLGVARRRWAEEHPGQQLPGEEVEEEGQPEEQAQSEEENKPEEEG
ncbi:hypothetical protein PG985_012754 [Apiospora marii]|uniref:uncharacterized protein n=1 Tax=Apiospora marii TaxID=335849 RepID=UPI00312D4D0F